MSMSADRLDDNDFLEIASAGFLEDIRSRGCVLSTMGLQRRMRKISDWLNATYPRWWTERQGGGGLLGLSRRA